MAIIIETDRIILRESVADDAEAFFEFNSDPDVMRFVGDEVWESVEHTREKLAAYPDYKEHGYGRWAVVYKPDNRVIGFNGLKYLDDLDEVDLGYRLLPEYWGRGIATESSRAVLAYGFDELNMDKIIGLVLPENSRSIHVLKKMGMRREGMKNCQGENAQYWYLTAEMYAFRNKE
jgi:ribosomal-protein-alanine N-acetyltransferase